jgi:hypothetical protein
VFKVALNKGGTMIKTAIHEEVRRMRFGSLLGRQECGEITQDEAAEMLGINVRTFQRWAGRYSVRRARSGRSTVGQAVAAAGTS